MVKAGKMTEKEAEMERQAQTAGSAEGAEKAVTDIDAKPVITYDDFAKCQFQVGEILDCKEVPKSKKLLCSQVRIGSETKQILSGIRQYYSAQEMIGKKYGTRGE